jgi:UDP-2,3-diacylglucosamine hydrolase
MTESEYILCISDLHLCPERPDLFLAFQEFLTNTAKGANSLYILGDLFNLWIGDDNPDPFNSTVSHELKNLASQGTNIFIMHGNRDFLLGKNFCESAKANLIKEPFILECFDESYLLLHGDSLCTQDTDYMAFRSMVRNPDWQHEFLSKPIEERIAFAQHAREQSKAMSSNKAQDIMDVTPEEVINVMQELNQRTLIHGHTHRPALHEIPQDSSSVKNSENSLRQRIVLGDWEKQGWYLKIMSSGSDLISFDIQDSNSLEH